jgi:hypothetical protein
MYTTQIGLKSNTHLKEHIFSQVKFRAAVPYSTEPVFLIEGEDIFFFFFSLSHSVYYTREKNENHYTASSSRTGFLSKCTHTQTTCITRSMCHYISIVCAIILDNDADQYRVKYMSDSVCIRKKKIEKTNIEKASKIKYKICEIRSNCHRIERSEKEKKMIITSFYKKMNQIISVIPIL